MYLETRYFRLISYLLHENWSNTLWKEIRMKIKNATSKHSPPHFANSSTPKTEWEAIFLSKDYYFVSSDVTWQLPFWFFSDPPWQMGWGVIIKALQQRHCMVVHYILWLQNSCLVAAEVFISMIVLILQPASNSRDQLKKATKWLEH